MQLTRRRHPSAALTDALKLLRRCAACSLGRSDIFGRRTARSDPPAVAAATERET